ncbi:hypothetical protein [Brevibacillus brevis]|uniref:hypothetical protein n=1 Tax=Brevibacillus brevis TaxID=1393 RepID=UPI000E3A85D8|nr:hypothetical protein [Brevibacillus brevis]RED21777.1 hypothetical protein DES34_11842 [Brevibacillus brevis]GEC92458.1 hypothetical protein BBR01nite_47890 [Brevibacillus brevis]VEF92640.1 Uncharacterised protein [Brevibacillus brevis]
MTHNGKALKWSEYHQSYGIFRAWRKHPKSQQILWARAYGKKAWFIPIEELEKEEESA